MCGRVYQGHSLEQIDRCRQIQLPVPLNIKAGRAPNTVNGTADNERKRISQAQTCHRCEELCSQFDRRRRSRSDNYYQQVSQSRSYCVLREYFAAVRPADVYLARAT